jgi:hypothetical protein
VEILEKLMAAITAGQVVRAQFILPRKERPVNTKLAPYRIIASLKDWAVIGRSTLHRRTLRIPIARLTSVEMTQEKFELPKNYRVRKLHENDPTSNGNANNSNGKAATNGKAAAVNGKAAGGGSKSGQGSGPAVNQRRRPATAQSA